MSQPLAKATPTDASLDPPPLLGSWPRVYAWVLISQFLVAAALWALARVYGAPQ